MTNSGFWLSLAVILCLAPAFPTAAQSPAVNARLADKSLLLDAAAAGSRLVAVGERGNALFSDDGGATWTQAKVPAQSLLTAVHMLDARLGWAVGHDATILHTQDGGVTWDLAHYQPGWQVPLLDVWFRDQSHGIVAGAFGLFLSTVDGGSTWRCGNGCWSIGRDAPDGPPLLRADESELEDDFHINAIAPASSGRIYLAGESGALYRSSDGGESWTTLPTPYEGSWFAALALDPDTVLVAGLRGNLFRSEDGGESWTRIETGTVATLTGLIRTRSGRILATGLAGEVLVSDDGGHTVSRRPLLSRQGLSTALETPASGILLLGEAGLTPLPGTE